MTVNLHAPLLRHGPALRSVGVFILLVALSHAFNCPIFAADGWPAGYWEGKFAGEASLHAIRFGTVDTDGKFAVDWDRQDQIAATGKGQVKDETVTVALNTGVKFVLARDADGNLTGFSIPKDGTRHPLTMVKKSDDPIPPPEAKGCDVPISTARTMPVHPMGTRHLSEGESLLEMFTGNRLVCHNGHMEVRQP